MLLLCLVIQLGIWLTPLVLPHGYCEQKTIILYLSIYLSSIYVIGNYLFFSIAFGLTNQSE